MRNNELDCFAHQKYMLNIFGISENKKFYFKVYEIIFYFILAMYPFLVLPEIIKMANDFDEIVFGIFFEIAYFISIINDCYFYYNKSKLIKLYKLLKSPIFQRNTEMYKGEKYFIRKLYNFIYKQSYFGSAAPLFILSLWITFAMILSIIEKEIRLPFGYGPHINNKIIQLLYHTLAYLLALYIANLHVWLYFNTMIFIIDHFRNLQKCITCISERSRMDFIQRSGLEFGSNAEVALKKNKHEVVATPWKFLKNDIKKIVSYHIAIMELSNEAEEIFNITNFVIFFGLMLCLCLLTYQSSLLKLQSVYFMRNIASIIYYFFLLFLLSYFGERVTTESQKVLQVCYDVDFVGTDIRFQKSLLFIMHRCQKPSIQTIGKVQIMCLNAYLMVCKSIYTYYTALQNVNK